MNIPKGWKITIFWPRHISIPSAGRTTQFKVGMSTHISTTNPSYIRYKPATFLGVFFLWFLSVVFTISPKYWWSINTSPDDNGRFWGYIHWLLVIDPHWSPLSPHESLLSHNSITSPMSVPKKHAGYIIMRCILNPNGLVILLWLKRSLR